MLRNLLLLFVLLAVCTTSHSLLAGPKLTTGKKAAPTLASQSFQESDLNPNTKEVLKSYDADKLRRGSYIDLGNGVVIFVRMLGTPAPDKPIIVMLPGLDDNLGDWSGLDKMLADQDYCVLTPDLPGQGYSLLRTGTNWGDLSFKAQVEVVDRLRKFVGSEKIVLAGLSYGGGIALGYAGIHPENVNKVFAFDPFIAPIEPQEDQILAMVSYYRTYVNPFISEEEAYEIIFRMVVYTTYPLTEPKILAHVNEPEAVVQLSVKLRGANISEVMKNAPAGSVVMIRGSEDKFVTQEVVVKAWKGLAANVRRALFTILGVGHRTTTDDPKSSFNIIHGVLDPNSSIEMGGEYVVDSTTHTITKVNRIEKRSLVDSDSKILTDKKQSSSGLAARQKAITAKLWNGLHVLSCKALF